MGVIVRADDIAAGAVIANIWAGSVFEYARTNGLLSMAVICTEAAVAGPIGPQTLLATINVGSDVVAEEHPIAVVNPAVTGEGVGGPRIPDWFWYQDAAAAGDRIVTQLRNATGGALAFYGGALFTPTR
jgi:hypothetical protein